MSSERPPARDPGESESARRAISRRMLPPLLAAFVIVGGFALLIQGTSHVSQPLADGTRALRSETFAGSTLSPPKSAPPISLRNYLGQPVNLAGFRGKAVLVTFLYTHCPTACPLIAADLHTALGMLSPAEAAKLQIIAVSVDPRGDTPKTVTAFLRVHQMTGRMLYLLGSTDELARVWKLWGVGSVKDAQEPDFINHTAIVYGIDADGRLRSLYTDTMNPREIAHDVPILAADGARSS
jgi:protein SCO1